MIAHEFEATCTSCDNHAVWTVSDPRSTMVKALLAQMDIWITTHRGSVGHHRYRKTHTTREYVTAVAPDTAQLQLVDDPNFSTFKLRDDDGIDL